MRRGGERVERAIAIVVIAVLSLATSCAPAVPTPTPTPEPTPTPVEVLATKPEHLEGAWLINYVLPGGALYYVRWDADGTIWTWQDREGQKAVRVDGRFRFEDGVYYEDSNACFVTGSYRVYLTIQGGQAVGLRFEEVDDSDLSCRQRLERRARTWTRVDR